MSEQVINLNTCKTGDKLLTRNGTIVTYCYRCYDKIFPHVIKYPTGSPGTRTTDGRIYVNRNLASDWDIVEILKEDYSPTPSHDYNDLLKLNIINLVKHHRKHCDGPKCNISLYLIEKLVQKAGISLTDEEKKLFW